MMDDLIFHISKRCVLLTLLDIFPCGTLHGSIPAQQFDVIRATTVCLFFLTVSER